MSILETFRSVKDSLFGDKSVRRVELSPRLGGFTATIETDGEPDTRNIRQKAIDAVLERVHKR